MVDSPRFSTRSAKQIELVRSIREKSITLVYGPAGTGKTSQSLQTLLDLIAEKKLSKIIVIRLITDTFDEHLGALPGEVDEKMLHFLGPILDNLYQIRTKSQVQFLINSGMLEVIPVSHVRGRTFVDCGVLIDEAQQMSSAMLLTCLTRIGDRSKLIFCGDKGQSDFLHKRPEGISYLEFMLDGLKDCGVIKLGVEDIVRHGVIKEIIMRNELYHQQK